ncbi:ATP nucleotide 3'-pyrophosphokinase [Streptomyces sp. NPDC007100]|uniref:ATP nucleotide 3'-pyrophosphokinase n=1 Tax=Streptomyces sp. NPDC007100 TaxID=3155602 RepID=UPI0033C84D0F
MPKPKPKPSASCGGTAPREQPPRRPSTQKPSSQTPSKQKPTTPKPSTQKPSSQRPPARKPPARKPAPKKPAPKKPQRRDHGWSWEGLYLDAADLRKVNVYLVRAKKAERTISPQVRAIARRTKATMFGYDDRLRSPESVKRSVARDLQDNPTQTVDDALGKINDSVRYILQWPDAHYVKAVKDTSAMLGRWKNPNIRWSNTWGRPRGYRAINTAWRAGDSTHPYELQFHTPRSRAAQKESRELHEETGRPGTTSQRRAQLAARQNQIFASVPVPKGAPLLRAPGRRV